jgi:hypothetical protein
MFVIRCLTWRRVDDRWWLSFVVFPDLAEQRRNTDGGLVLAADGPDWRSPRSELVAGEAMPALALLVSP